MAAPMRLTLAGRVDSENYQKNRECVEYLEAERGCEYQIKVLEMLPFEWWQHLETFKESVAQPTQERIGSLASCLVYTEGGAQVWVEDEFARDIATKTKFRIFDFPENSDDPESYANAAKRKYRAMLKATGHTFCTFTFRVGDVVHDQVVIELFTDKCPRTCENFRHLCLGDMGPVTDPNVRPQGSINLHYQGTHVVRIVKDGWIQGGDIVNDRGNAGYSIYGPSFPAESFDVRHVGEGIVGMVNNGDVNSNASQFYITVGSNGWKWMDGKYAAFGRVIEGIDVVRHIHTVKTKHNQMPETPVQIVATGQLELSDA